MSFTCEEIWQYLPATTDRPATVHAAKFPSPEQILGTDIVTDSAKEREEWATLRAVREEVLKALEEARNSKMIGGGLEAKVTVAAPESIYAVLARHREQLRYLFIVSAVRVEQGASGNGSSGVTVRVEKAPGQKCERCWNYSTHVGEDPVYATVCERCSAVLKEIEAQVAAGESK